MWKLELHLTGESYELTVAFLHRPSEPEQWHQNQTAVVAKAFMSIRDNASAAVLSLPEMCLKAAVNWEI